MSSTLVETQTLLHHNKSSSSLPALHSDDPHAPPGIPSLEERLAAQLFHLASQHHTSEYNRLKFGPRGSPLAYVPLSLHMPEYYKQLQERQTRQSQGRAWWPCNQSPTTTDEALLTPTSPHIVPATQAADLQQALSAAIGAPLQPSQQLQQPSHPATQQQPPSAPPLKTSESHPINVSAIIPPELIPIISSHLVEAQNPSPTLFDLSLQYNLDRMTAYPPPYYTRPHSISYSPSHRYEGKKISIPFSLSPSPYHHAMQAAIDSKIPGIVAPSPPPTTTASTRHSVDISSATELTDITVSKSTAVSLRTNASCSFTKAEMVARFSPALKNPFISARLPSLVRSGHRRPLSSLISSVAVPKRQSIAADVPVLPPTIPPVPVVPALPCAEPKLTSHAVTLGNLFLSSCPGKKVRLSGPIRGRGGVCRDLRADLGRIKALGVGCVVCCLDDEELELLGAPWSEYSRFAAEVGLDVLRIPIPEGLTPLSPALLDTHLTHLIKNYTLNTIPILVHCRGGVGRAGLVACCWTLKLGLCGWIETDPGYYGLSLSDFGLSAQAGFGACEGEVRRDTMQLVGKVIGLVRRRRSLKAVETYEQVKFLVDYVEFLRERSRVARGMGVEEGEERKDSKSYCGASEK